MLPVPSPRGALSQVCVEARPQSGAEPFHSANGHNQLLQAASAPRSHLLGPNSVRTFNSVLGPGSGDFVER